MTGPDANTQDTHPTRPLLGVAGVLFGALIATCTGHLTNVGLADIRGALHLVLTFAGFFQVNRLFRGEMGFTFMGTSFLFERSSTPTCFFLLLTMCCVTRLAVVCFMSKAPTQYRQVTAAPVEVK
jgi:hypothetical protein